MRVMLTPRSENSLRALTRAPGWSAPSSEKTREVLRGALAGASISTPWGVIQTKRVVFSASSSTPSRRI